MSDDHSSDSSGGQNDQYEQFMHRLEVGRTITPNGWVRQPQKKMLMSPLMSSVGALIAFFTVVVFVVWLPDNTFAVHPSRFWTPMSNLALRGRQVFLDNGCVYCHSGFSRPQDVLSGQLYLYPRPSYTGDYFGDWEQSPNLLGTERTGPDLSMEAGYHPNDWQRAHYYNPRNVEPISLMPRFSFLDTNEVEALIAFNNERSGKDGLIRNATQQVAKHLALASMAPTSTLKRRISDCVPAGKDKYKNCGVQPPIGLTYNQDNPSYVKKWRYCNDHVLGDYESPVAKDMKKYGKNGADEADEFSILTHDRSYWLANDPLPVTQENLLRGRSIVEQRCMGCHGSQMDGKGPGAVFLSPPPIDFTAKDDACCGPDTSPGDLYYRILLGVPGTGMHNFSQMLTVSDIWRVVLFLKTIPNGGLKTSVPKVSQYIQWKPTAEIKDFIKSYPIEDMFPYKANEELKNPFEIAARTIVPGLGVGEKFYIHGKPYTLQTVANMIKANYKHTITRAYQDAVGRHEANLPPFSTLCCSQSVFYDVLPIPPTYFTVGLWPKGEMAYVKHAFNYSVSKQAENYFADLAGST
jgi:cbb3-type cytochrome c oxidase subunit II